MPEYAIRVLCRDDRETCSLVKRTLMNEYTIKESEDRDNFDHVGIKSFESHQKALEEAKRLKKVSNGNILDIAVSPM